MDSDFSHTDQDWFVYAIRGDKALEIGFGTNKWGDGPEGRILKDDDGFNMEDAMLICAAPKLLAALKALLPRVPISHYTSPEREDAERAIALAERKTIYDKV